MGICANSKPKDLPRSFTQNEKEFESFDFSSPKGKNENSAIPVQNVHEIYKFESFLGSGGFGTGFKFKILLQDFLYFFIS